MTIFYSRNIEIYQNIGNMSTNGDNVSTYFTKFKYDIDVLFIKVM